MEQAQQYERTTFLLITKDRKWGFHKLLPLLFVGVREPKVILIFHRNEGGIILDYETIQVDAKSFR